MKKGVSGLKIRPRGWIVFALLLIILIPIGSYFYMLNLDSLTSVSSFFYAIASLLSSSYIMILLIIFLGFIVFNVFFKKRYQPKKTKKNQKIFKKKKIKKKKIKPKKEKTKKNQKGFFSIFKKLNKIKKPIKVKPKRPSIFSRNKKPFIRKIESKKSSKDIKNEDKTNPESTPKKIPPLKFKLGPRETEIDAVYKTIKQKGKISIEQISKMFDVDLQLTEEWIKILEDGSLIDIHYPTFGSPMITIAKSKGKKEDEIWG